MRVFITGHRGYLGSILVPMLVARGHEVCGSDTRLFESCHFVGDMHDAGNLGKDVRDLTTQDLQGFDAVIHLAALSNDPMGDYRPELTRDINFKATEALARSAVRADVSRFVFASSCSVYGAAGEEFLDEDSPFNPVSPYAESKALSERQINLLASESFSPVHTRCGTVYGVSPRIRFDLVLNNLVAWAMATGVVRLKSDGRVWRPLVHVEDVARAYIEILEAPREAIHRQAFNIGRTQENYRVVELAHIVETAVPDARVEIRNGAATDQRNYRVRCDKLAQRLPNWQSRWTVEQGVAQLVDALRLFPVMPEAFEGKTFSRIAHVKYLLERGEVGDDLRFRLKHE